MNAIFILQYLQCPWVSVVKCVKCFADRSGNDNNDNVSYCYQLSWMPIFQKCQSLRRFFWRHLEILKTQTKRKRFIFPIPSFMCFRSKCRESYF